MFEFFLLDSLLLFFLLDSLLLSHAQIRSSLRMATNSPSSSSDIIISSSSSSYQIETPTQPQKGIFWSPSRRKSKKLMMGFTLSDNRRKNKGGRPWCDQCRKSGHSRETCWKIHGKLANWKPSQLLEKEGRGNHVAIEKQSPQLEASPFNKEQWRYFRNYCLLFC